MLSKARMQRTCAMYINMYKCVHLTTTYLYYYHLDATWLPSLHFCCCMKGLKHSRTAGYPSQQFSTSCFVRDFDASTLSWLCSTRTLVVPRVVCWSVLSKCLTKTWTMQFDCKTGNRQGGTCSASNFASKSFHCGVNGFHPESRTGEAHESDDALLKDCDHPWCADSREVPWLCVEMDYPFCIYLFTLIYDILWHHFGEVWISRRMVQGEREEEDCFRKLVKRWNLFFELSCDAQERHLDAMMEIERLKVGKSSFCKLNGKKGKKRLEHSQISGKSLEALKMYEVREQVINSADEVINSLESIKLCFGFLIFEIHFEIWNLVCILCLFAFSFVHEFVWEVDGSNWTCQRGLCAALVLTQERLTSQRSGAKVIIEQIKVKSWTFFKKMVSQTDLTWKHQSSSIYNLLGNLHWQDRQAQRMKEEEHRDQEPKNHQEFHSDSFHRISPTIFWIIPNWKERAFVLKQIESLKAEEVEQQPLDLFEEFCVFFLMEHWYLMFFCEWWFLFMVICCVCWFFSWNLLPSICISEPRQQKKLAAERLMQEVNEANSAAMKIKEAPIFWLENSTIPRYHLWNTSFFFIYSEFQ